MKDTRAEHRHIEFYSPSGNHYRSQMKLWFIAKVTISNGNPWLETEWSGSEGDIHRLSLYTSRLDAEIQCLSLQALIADPGLSVYEFSDLDFYHMMKTMFARGHTIFGLSVIFGFSASACAELHPSYKGVSTVGTPCDIAINHALLQNPQPTFEFSRLTFQYITECWHSAYPNFVASTNNINELEHDEIMVIARQALSCAAIQPAPTNTGLARYASTFCPERQCWVASSELNRIHFH